MASRDLLAENSIDLFAKTLNIKEGIVLTKGQTPLTTYIEKDLSWTLGSVGDLTSCVEGLKWTGSIVRIGRHVTLQMNKIEIIPTYECNIIRVIDKLDTSFKMGANVDLVIPLFVDGCDAVFVNNSLGGDQVCIQRVNCPFKVGASYMIKAFNVSWIV